MKKAIVIICLLLASITISVQAAGLRPFVIKVVDRLDQRPLPLVVLELENGLQFVTDNDGHISILKPDLQGRQVRFIVKGHGYITSGLDFFKQQSFVVKIEPGKTAVLQLVKDQLADRLYRVTGAGRYNHTLLAGKVPSFLQKELLPGQVIGQDSLICLPWKNKLWHFYGDTLGLTSYNFSASCATSPMPETAACDPDVGIPLDYITDENGFAAPMINTGQPGFTWIEYVLPVNLPAGKQTLLAKYVQHKTLEKVAEAGFAIFSQAKKRFSVFRRLPEKRPHKCTHPVPVKYQNETAFLLFPWELTLAGLSEISNEAEHYYFSPLVEIAHVQASKDTVEIKQRSYQIERQSDGAIKYSWKKGGAAMTPEVQKLLFAKGLIKPQEMLFAPIDLESGERLKSFNGSIVYNSFKKCWIAINQGNKAGEIFYSEADTPTGPWAFAVRVAKFNDYNLYNPIIHPWFNKNAGQKIYFEGTYTNFFSDSKGKTAEADYNQVMFSLDLALPELELPIPVYLVKDRQNVLQLFDAATIEPQNLWKNILRLEFFAFAAQCDNPDLLQPEMKKGRPFPFKVLKKKPQTKWGTRWLNKAIKPYVKNCAEQKWAKEHKNGNLAEGLVIKVPDQALTMSVDIKNLGWKEVYEYESDL
jgi:hypothetical protein